ncbi:SusD/RagB family nutrient-binding outer membrane lipoprotein [Nitritalea halalkaliphila]|uniref:SusD/RagB family nutrient-binding outer membrane lipoprotein n=1 Tax=Nitritalea halalkaliphila TaxID=590849 RepID=UPI00058DC74D|nr:SusD/RagB family nutrient-binding outer membrane lipoprotein [Nitritalea halalkaliphila]
MRKYINKLSVWTVGVAAGLVVSSCDLQEANINPNAVTDAPINVVLPAAQANMTWAIGDFSSQSASTLVQYITGILNVQQNVTFYAYVPANFQTTWNNHYYRSLQGLKKIIEDGEAAGALHYSGIGKIQTALVLGHLVDLFGDVPFSEALNPEEFPTPRFDSAEQLYDEIFRLLDEGIADLNAESSASPSIDDLVFPATNANNWRANSRPNWIKSAHALKARYANHLSKVDPQGSAQAALAAIQAGAIDSNAANLNVIFGTTPDAAGPWFGFLQGTFGQNNIALNNTFLSKLIDRISPGVSDPRLPFYARANSAGEFVGAITVLHLFPLMFLLSESMPLLLVRRRILSPSQR